MDWKKMEKISILVTVILIITALYGCSLEDKQEKNGDYAEDIKYDFSEQAEAYLNILGTEFQNRNLVQDESDVEKNTRLECGDWIVEELKKAGYGEEDIMYDTFSVYNQEDLQGRNIVVTLQGQDDSKQIIVGAHYDGDGVGDNASGVALLLANACGLASEKPDTMVKFIFFDGEEEGELGSSHYVENMTKTEIKNTIYMINIDSIAFGDYCNVYGGEVGVFGNVVRTSGYELAMERAEQLGFKTYTTKDLDGYYAEHQSGPELETDAIYTNPWTKKNPSPENFDYPSPTTGGWGDQAAFSDKGIPYIYFEATNWYAEGDGGEWAYTGYFDTNEKDKGKSGMFMNTEEDTLEILNKYFSNRAKEHFALYSPLLASLVLHGR